MNRYKLYKAGVDITGALERLGGDKELYEELLKTFRQGTRVSDLENAMAEGNVQKAFAAAHALKGESGNMGFTRLYDAVCQLVEKLRVGDLSDTQPMLTEIKAAYQVLTEAIG